MACVLDALAFDAVTRNGIAAEAANISRINVAFAGTIMAFLPMLLLVVAFQRYLVRGLFGGSVKG